MLREVIFHIPKRVEKFPGASVLAGHWGLQTEATGTGLIFKDYSPKGKRPQVPVTENAQTLQLGGSGGNSQDS